MILVHKNANELCPKKMHSTGKFTLAFIIAFICVSFEFFFELTATSYWFPHSLVK